MIHYVTGNLLEAPAAALINAVNTVGVMGKGIALQFKQAFPYTMKVYGEACRQQRFGIGDLLVVRDSNPLLGEKIIINFPTKIHWKDPSHYDYIEKGLKSLPAIIEQYSIKSIALPALGCGNGGLTWDRVKPLIDEHLEGLPVDAWVFLPL